MLVKLLAICLVWQMVSSQQGIFFVLYNILVLLTSAFKIQATYILVSDQIKFLYHLCVSTYQIWLFDLLICLTCNFPNGTMVSGSQVGIPTTPQMSPCLLFNFSQII